MSPFVIMLILISTFMHAGWNLLARSQRREATFFWRMLLAVIVVGLLPAGVSEFITRSLTPKAWVCVSISGVFAGVYMFALARAYGESDFTVVYPVARALPVVLVGVADMLRSRCPTTLGWVGMTTVVAGCMLAPLHSFRDFAFRRYANRTIVWILVAALTTVGFTMFDKVAAEDIRQSYATAARYAFTLYIFWWLTYSVLLWLFKAPEEGEEDPGWILPVLGGLCTYGSYSLVVWAYQLAPHASYIVAFRQFSIVLGVAAAFVLYRERGLAVRLAGTLLITAGLVLIALFGGEATP